MAQFFESIGKKIHPVANELYLDMKQIIIICDSNHPSPEKYIEISAYCSLLLWEGFVWTEVTKRVMQY